MAVLRIMLPKLHPELRLFKMDLTGVPSPVCNVLAAIAVKAAALAAGAFADAFAD